MHPCGVQELLVDPLPEGSTHRQDALYPDGAHITDLKHVREILYKMQRPAIAPRVSSSLSLSLSSWHRRIDSLIETAGLST